MRFVLQQVKFDMHLCLRPVVVLRMEPDLFKRGQYLHVFGDRQCPLFLLGFLGVWGVFVEVTGVVGPS